MDNQQLLMREQQEAGSKLDLDTLPEEQVGEFLGRVLVVSPYYWPSAAVGAKRFCFLSDELRKCGFEVSVLCMRADAHDGGYDYSLPKSGTVHAVRSVLPPIGRARRLIPTLFQTPDKFVGWLPSSLFVGRKVVNRYRPDVIIATGPPFTGFLTGLFLKNVSGAKLILDYRDPWSAFDWQTGRQKARRQGRVHQHLERRVVKAADSIVFATDSMRQHFHEQLGDASPMARLHVLTNGFNDARTVPARQLAQAPDEVSILYAGAFYGERRISTLTDALVGLKSKGALKNRRPVIHVFGKLRPGERDQIAAMGFTDLVREHARIDHASILGFMKGADVLYLQSGRDMLYSLPYKIFDYLSVRRPILAVAPRDSAVSDLMAEVACGELAHAEEPQTVIDALELMLKAGRKYSFAGAEKYSWSTIGHGYASIVSELVKTNTET